MMALLELQRQMAKAVMQPLTSSQTMRKRNSQHQLMTEIASSFIDSLEEIMGKLRLG